MMVIYKPDCVQNWGGSLSTSADSTEGVGDSCQFGMTGECTVLVLHHGFCRVRVT